MSTSQEVTIVDLPLTSVKPYWRNPRINYATVPALIKSIKRYGFNVPLVVDKNYVLVTGHARYKALNAMGVTHVPCVVNDLTEEQNREFRIMDNKVQEHTRWDDSALSLELAGMPTGADLQLHFDGTLDKVLDFDGLTGGLSSFEEYDPNAGPQDGPGFFGAAGDGTASAGALAGSAGSDAAEAGEEGESSSVVGALCPYCSTCLTVDDIIPDSPNGN